MWIFKPQDHYFHKAKKLWYNARSVFKLEEIDQKNKIFIKGNSSILDLGCCPWSWLQYIHQKTLKFTKNKCKIIWIDISETKISLPGVLCYQMDATKAENITKIMEDNKISKFDVICSDIAPNTIWVSDIDAIRSINILKETLYIYENYLAPNSRFVIKIFMWQWFDEFVAHLKKRFGSKSIKLFKPSATRKASKEMYIIWTCSPHTKL